MLLALNFKLISTYHVKVGTIFTGLLFYIFFVIYVKALYLKEEALNRVDNMYMETEAMLQHLQDMDTKLETDIINIENMLRA